MTECKRAVVNESSVFEPLKVDCIRRIFDHFILNLISKIYQQMKKNFKAYFFIRSLF